MIGKFIKLLFAVLLIGGIIFACVKLFDRDTKTISMFDFEVGAIDESGNYTQSKQSIYTKEMFPCAGLNVEPSFEYSGTYRIFFYNMDRDFISSTENLTKVYTEVIPDAARYARVMLTPDAPLDEDASSFSINYFEKFGYAREVTISVSKNQTFKNLLDTLSIEDGKTFIISYDGASYELVAAKNRSVLDGFNYQGNRACKLVNNSLETVYILWYKSINNQYELILVEPGGESIIESDANLRPIGIGMPIDYKDKVFLYAYKPIPS